MTISRRYADSTVRFAIVAAMLACASCSKKADPQVFVSAQTALEQGLEAHQNQDYQTAVSHLDTALSGGGLLPDLYSQALLTRAECNARLGNFPAAHADLDTAARGADMSKVHQVRSFVLDKEGKKAGSQSEYAKAKKINPQIRPIAD